MPGWQSRRVHREPRLPRERAGHYFSARQDGGVLCPETDRLSELHEMLALEFVTCEKCANVARAKVRLLERQLRGACQRRNYIRIKRNIAECENIFVPVNLKCWFDDNKPPPIFFNGQIFDESVDARGANG